MDAINCIPSIYIYIGEGKEEVSASSVDRLKQIFETAYPNTPIYEVMSSEFSPSKWRADSLVILPDGKCSEWKWLNNPSQVSEFQNFVHRGAYVLALGGGAFACCKESEYTVSFNQVLNNARGLDLCSGKGIGPLFPHAISTTGIEPETIKLSWLSSQQKGYAVISGGGYFVFNDSEHPKPNCEVLATYCDQPKEKSVAIVKCLAGKGMAILSFANLIFQASDYPLGVLENMAENLPEFRHIRMTKLRKTHSEMSEGEDFRANCLKSIRQIFEENACRNLYLSDSSDEMNVNIL